MPNREGCIPCAVRSDAVWGCIRDTLPLTSPCSGTKRKTAVPLFFASTGGLRLSLLQPHTAIASTHCLYSPSLPRLSVSTGKIGLLSFMPILHLSLQFIDCYNPSLRRLSQVPAGLDYLSFRPILHLSL